MARFSEINNYYNNLIINSLVYNMKLQGDWLLQSLLWRYCTSQKENRMKPSNKRINKKKASKVTLKTHRKLNRTGDLHEQMKKAAEGVSSIRPEDIKMHQHY